ncbi:MAG: isoprenylcysteine carboxylmethyltransferase family protein [candidate division WOR-3 bacterium]|nr:isoprenylcysteine carboxylmethyltransferase family protein [candidate division WOR-3 bacterium]
MKRPIVDYVLMSVVVTSLVVNTIFINITPPVIKALVYVGLVLLGIGILLLIIAIVTLRQKGTAKLVDTGIYGIVRHPIYLAAMIMFFSHIFLGQHLVVLVSTAAAIACCYVSMVSGDQQNIEKFGDDYVQYMKRVPCMNFIAGMARKISSPEK